ncbi:MAG: aldo/keto reductase [Cyanobacteria bacterium SZAS LIN-2]|nr:aldo/keto reductase [Cyanobacteria bacterium SZAS LIN-3]MBS1998717.1 aldo/keto reductase [Cyanobacteria bacterium SZAS LIN-2]MBS2009094.1 aldo/keto reductase [Cyanobacteria bacterium SZAS TMP-1]
MSLNHYITLGNSGLRVSPFCLGTMTFGMEWGWGSTEEESHNILNHFFEKGGNFIDTANVYTKGHSELIIGNWLQSKAVRRDQAVIATKFFGTLYPGDPNAGGANRKSIIAACDASLRRLQTDYIDLYWMHCWDYHTPIEETMAALDDLVRQGKLRYIGFSDTPAWKVTQAQMIAKFRGWAPLVALQIEYSLLERTVEGELIPMAKEMGLGVTPWSPLKYGILTGKYTRENKDKVEAGRGEWVTGHLKKESTYEVIDVLLKVAKELKTSPAKVALAWLQAKPGVTSSIIGARTMEQLDDNLGALDLVLAPEHMAQLDKVSEAKLNFPADFVKNSGPFRSAETTINGEVVGVSAMAPKSDAERFDNKVPASVR